MKERFLYIKVYGTLFVLGILSFLGSSGKAEAMQQNDRNGPTTNIVMVNQRPFPVISASLQSALERNPIFKMPTSFTVHDKCTNIDNSNILTCYATIALVTVEKKLDAANPNFDYFNIEDNDLKRTWDLARKHLRAELDYVNKKRV